MTQYTCPRYSGQGAGAGRATCEFFAGLDTHPAVKWTAIITLLVAMFLCLRYLRTGKVL